MGTLPRRELVGRLLDAFEAAASGTGRLVLVGGEAGAGKSTLVRLLSDSTSQRASIVRGLCEPLTTPRPAGALLDMAQRLGEPLASALAEGRHAGLLDAR